MIVRINVALRNLILSCMFTNGIPAAIFDNGTAQMRTGAMPADADTAATGIVVATIALPPGAMANPVNGTISKNAALWQDLAADADGTMTWSRWKDATSLYVMDFDVSGLAGNGAIKVDNPALLQNQPFQVIAAAITMPGSNV